MTRIISTLVFFAIAIIVTLSACSSGKAALEHGNYYQAVLTSVNQLRRNPGHKKSTETLRAAYPLAVSYYEGLANNALSSNAQFKWTEVVNSYTALNQMGDEIRRSPGALAVISNPANYSGKLNEARQNAAEEQYQAGIMALGLGTRDKAKEAYQYFKRSTEFVAGYKDANQKMQDALWAATVKVLVEPIPTQSRSLAVSTDFFNARLSEYLHQDQNRINQFVKFYTPAETQQLKLYPDHIVRLEFDEFTVGNVFMSEKQIPLKRDSVVMTSYVTNNLVNQNTPTNQNPQINQTNTVINQNTVINNQNTTNTQNTTNNTVVVTNPSTNTNQTAGNQPTNTGTTTTPTTNQNTNTNTVPVNQTTTTNSSSTETGTSQNTNPPQTTGNPSMPTNQTADTNTTNQNSTVQNTTTTQNQGNSGTNQTTGNTGSTTSNPPTEEIKVEPIPADEQVIICHVPPGNAAARHTLTIAKSALKAHLEHGDFEGACDDPKNSNKLKEVDKKSAEQKKTEKTPELKGGDNKSNDKGTDKKGNGGGLVQRNYQPVLIASASNDLAWQTLVETNTWVDTVKVYGTVKATLYYYAKTITSRGVLNFSIVDARTKAVLSVVKIPSEYVWKSEWATFNGDERALTPQQLAITRNREQMPPSNQDMFRLFTEPIFQQVTQKIRDFYKGY